MTAYTPHPIPLLNPADHAFTVRHGSLTYVVAGHAGEWAAALVSPLRGFRGPFGYGRTRDAAVRDLEGRG